MNKLLKEGFSRVFHDKLFYAAVFAALALGCVAGYTKYRDLLDGFAVDLSDTLFSCGYIAAFALSVFTPMFTGTEYSDGVLRNKIIAGHKRWEIYLANQLFSVTVGAIVYLFFIVPHGIIMYFVAGPSAVPAGSLFLLAGIGLLAVFACSAVYNAVTMLRAQKAASAVSCILLALTMFMLAMTLDARLNAEEYVREYELSEDGEMEAKMRPNPKYLTGAKRAAYQAAYDILPMGQILQVLTLKVSRPALLAAYSLALYAIMTSAGIVVFCKKDLR